jgi:2-phospho-L-lactate/phosphoenolpyruvate guanylyltransferase
MPERPTIPAGVVLPIRTFIGGKSRLSPVLTAIERRDLLQAMASTVVTAAGRLPVLVVSSAPEVKEWAGSLDLEVVHDPGSLDDAAAYGRRLLEARGVQRVVVAHADLPRARSLEPVLGQPIAADGARGVMAIVACHRGDGTPVISLPSGVPFRFHYGPGSFRAHLTEAARRGLIVHVVDDATLAYDVDGPDDLRGLGL